MEAPVRTIDLIKALDARITALEALAKPQLIQAPPAAIKKPSIAPENKKG